MFVPIKPVSKNIKTLQVMSYGMKKKFYGHFFRTMNCSLLIASGLRLRKAIENKISHQNVAFCVQLIIIRLNILKNVS